MAQAILRTGPSTVSIRVEQWACAGIDHHAKGIIMELNTATPHTNLAAGGIDISLLLSNAAQPAEHTHTVSVLFDEEGNHAAGFEIVGKNSEQYRRAIRATSVSAIKRSQTKKQQIDGKTDAGAGQLYDLGEDRNLKIAKAIVVGLPGFVSEGAPLPVSDATLDALFAKFPAWIDKIVAALEVDANFLMI